MAQTVDISFVPALQDTIQSLFQEEAAGLRESVRVRNITGKTDKWERLGGVELAQVTTRHQATPHTPMTHSARLAVLSDYAGAEFLDQLDQVKMMIDPKSEYTRNLAKAWERRIFRTVQTAISGNAISVDNQDARTNVALPTSQAIANGGTNLTLAKVRQAHRLLDNAGVPRDGERTILISVYGIEKLLSDSQVTSADYSSMQALMQGNMPLVGSKFMGLRWIVVSDAVPDETSVVVAGSASTTQAVPSGALLPKTGNIRTGYMYHKSAVGLSFAMDLKTEVNQRSDLMNSWQVLVQGSLGAVRILDAGVVSIDYDETA